MRAIMIRCALVMPLGAAIATPVAAQDYPPAGYAPLLFSRTPPQHVFRLAGVPWLCVADSICKPVRVEGVADRDLATATIAPLGFADRRFHLSFQHPGHNKGRPVVLSCMDDRCARLDASTGDAAFLGAFQVKQDDRMSGRAAILRTLDERNGRAQILWCAEAGCAELPITRDNDLRLAFLGTAKHDGRERIWLRERDGPVMACVQPELDIDDRLECERTPLALADFPRAGALAPIPPSPQPAVSSTDADQRALAAAIDQALRANDLVTAERMLADGVRRFPGYATSWTPLRQRLAQAKTERDRQARAEEARRLILEARRLASLGDFAGAELLLQEADRLSPGFAETARTRTEIAQIRAERGQRYRERYQYNAAIEQALSTYALWEAERLTTEALQRFPNDAGFRAQANQIARMRQQVEWQNRLTRARAATVAARRAMERGDFFEAERQLAVADQAAPGLPEANQLRVELSRARVRAETQNDQIRWLIAALEAAILARRFDDADRIVTDGSTRYPGYQGWVDQRRRLAAARQGDDRQFREQSERRERAGALVAQARRTAAQGDYDRAQAMLNEASELAPGMQDIAIARADIERQRSDRQRQDAEIRAVVASIDAAIARNQIDNAERLLSDGARRYPQYGGWSELTRRVADAKRAANARPPATKPADTMPPQAKPAETKPADTKPAESKPADTRPAGTKPPQAKPADKPADTQPAETVPADTKPGDKAADKPNRDDPQLAAQVRGLLFQARQAIARNDFVAAEKAVVEAERVDGGSRDVIAVRAELEAAERRAGRRERGKN